MNSHFKNQACCDCLALLEDIRKRQEFYTGELIMEISELKQIMTDGINKIAALEAENAALKALPQDVADVATQLEAAANQPAQ